VTNLLPSHKTKIVCTIGPASSSPEVMEKMIRAGMNIARLNMSHGSFESHRAVVKALRAASGSVGQRVAIMADLPGPKVRIGKISPEPVFLKPDSTFVLTTDEVTGDAKRATVNLARLPEVVKPGDVLYLNDGLVQLSVTSVRGRDVLCDVVVGGELRSRKGLNFPGIDLGVSAFTERDRECLAFAASEGIDAVSQSFVQTGADIHALRKAADALGYQPFIIAKIERSIALDHIEEILGVTDAVMIARGDLGQEAPIERIAVIQKELTYKANQRAKPVITATQMLQSMTRNARPTRAEVTDVSNAILDGTDGVMLSEESATGEYPLESVAMLSKIAEAVEPRREMVGVKEMYPGLGRNRALKPAHLVAIGVEASLEYACPAAIFAPTHSGLTARGLTVFRPPVWIVAVSTEERTCQQLAFSYGVLPVREKDYPDDWKSYARKWVAANGVEGDIAVLVEGPSAKHPEANHRMEIIELGRL
jgi:pyruvate kinase